MENIKDPIASLIETNTNIAEKKEENAINLEPFGGNTNIDTLIKSEANQNNNAMKLKMNMNISEIPKAKSLFFDTSKFNKLLAQ